MRASIISAAGLLLASVNAISITAPGKHEQVDLNDFSYTVTWSTVSSDPSTAHLYLVNLAGGHTPYSKDLGEVDLTKGSYTVSKLTINPDTDYQFNLQSVSQYNTGILAQSQQFDIIKSNATSSTTTSASSSTKTAGSGSNPGQSTVGTTGLSTATSASSSSTATTAANSTSTSTATTTPNAANSAKVATGSFLALLLGAFAVIA